MEQTMAVETASAQGSEISPTGPTQLVKASPTPAKSVAPACGCAAGGAASAPTYVYVIGNLRPAYPSVSVKEAFEWAVGAAGTDAPDYSLEYLVMSQDENLA